MSTISPNLEARVRDSSVSDSEKANDECPEMELLFEGSTHYYLIYVVDEDGNRSINLALLGLLVVVFQSALYGILIHAGFGDDYLAHDKVAVEINKIDCYAINEWKVANWTVPQHAVCDSSNIHLDDNYDGNHNDNRIYLILAMILVAFFLQYDYLASISVILNAKSKWSKFAALLIFIEALLAMFCCSIFAFQGVTDGSGYDAIMNTIGVLFVHDVDEKLFEALGVINSKRLFKKKKVLNEQTQREEESKQEQHVTPTGTPTAESLAVHQSAINETNSTFRPHNQRDNAPAFSGDISKVDSNEYDPNNSNAKAFGVHIFANERNSKPQQQNNINNEPVSKPKFKHQWQLGIKYDIGNDEIILNITDDITQKAWRKIITKHDLYGNKEVKQEYFRLGGIIQHGTANYTYPPNGIGAVQVSLTRGDDVYNFAADQIDNEPEYEANNSNAEAFGVNIFGNERNNAPQYNQPQDTYNNTDVGVINSKQSFKHCKCVIWGCCTRNIKLWVTLFVVLCVVLIGAYLLPDMVFNPIAQKVLQDDYFASDIGKLFGNPDNIDTDTDTY